MNLASLDRWKASAIHLSISVAIGLSVIALMWFLWYPQPYFEAMGGETLILLLIGVDVVIGPLITLIIYNPTKKSLRFDLAVIAVLQLAALVYGCTVMFEARPVYTVFVVDRFEVIAANAIDPDSSAKVRSGEFQSLPLTGPRVIAARQPDDPKRQAEIVMSAVNGGPDLANLPELYVPYAQFRRDAGRVARPLDDLANRQPQAAATIRTFVLESKRGGASLGYIPLKARNRDMAVVLDTQSGDVVGILPVYPW